MKQVHQYIVYFISVLDVVESTSINSNTILHPNISFIKSTKFDGVNYLNNSSKTKKDSNLEDINLGVVPRTINDTYEDYVRKQEQSTSPQTKVKKEPKSLKEPIILHRSNSNSVVQNSEANVSYDNEQWDHIMALNFCAIK